MSSVISKSPRHLQNVGIEPVYYPYYNADTVSLDFDGIIDSMKNAAPRSVFLLHSCAHNPTVSIPR